MLTIYINVILIGQFKIIKIFFLLKMSKKHLSYKITSDIKKIEHYVFKFSDFLGKGNFSSVYKGINGITSKTSNNYRWCSSNKIHHPFIFDLLATSIVAGTINLDIDLNESSKHCQMFLGIKKWQQLLHYYRTMWWRRFIADAQTQRNLHLTGNYSFC